MFFYKKLSAHLSAAVESEAFAAYFASLKSTNLLLATFDDLPAMVTAFERGCVSYEEQDAIVLELVKEFQSRPSEHLHHLLLKMFWKGLDHLYRARRIRVGNNENLWNDIVWAFLNVLSEYPTDRLTAKVAANIQMGTLKKVSRWAQREARYQLFSPDEKHPKRTEYEFTELLTSGFSHPNEIFAGRGTPDEMDAEDMERMTALLRRFLNTGIISDDAFYLLVSTRIYGQSLKDFAEKESIPYQALKKRRQRAEQAIREHLKKNSPDDVPFANPKGLFGVDPFEDEGGADERTRNE